MWDKAKNLVSKRKTNSFPRRYAMKGNGTENKTLQKGKNLNNSKAWVSNPEQILLRKGFLKGSQPKGDASEKPKGACFNCNETGHYSKDCPKLKLGNGGSKIIAHTANLAQSEHNHLIFLKGKVSKQKVLCLLDIGASHNFITQENVERMELQLEELKAPIEVHFADGIPHPTTL